MNISEARRLEQAEADIKALREENERLYSIFETMVPKGPGRKPEWVRLLRQTDETERP